MFLNDLARVKFDGKWGIINEEETLVVPFEYDEIKAFNADRKTTEVRIGDKWGLIHRSGRVIMPCEYDNMKYNWRRSGIFEIRRGKYIGIADHAGVICPPLFKKIKIKEDLKIVAEVELFNGDSFYLDLNGSLYPIKKRSSFKKFFEFGSLQPMDYVNKFHYSELKLDK